MAKQTINLGTMADNKSGDPLRTAFTKVNENFTELYDRPAGTADLGKLIISGAVIGTTDDEGGWGGYDIYLAPNGEGWAWIGVPNDANAANGASLVFGNTHPNGSGVQIVTNGGSWQFQNSGILQLPTNGDIVNSDGNSVLSKGSVSQQQPSSYGALTAVESSPASNVNWTQGTGVAGGVANVNISIAMTDGVPTFTINDAGLPGRYVGELIIELNGSALGGVDGEDDMIIIASSVSDATSVIDLTKSVHVLDDGDYELLDGYEGQVLTFVPKTNRSVWIKVSKLSFMSYDDNTQSFNLRTIGADYWINPFWISDQSNNQSQATNLVVTAVFANGAWNFSNGIID